MGSLGLNRCAYLKLYLVFVCHAFVCLLGRLANFRAKSSGTHSCVIKTIGLLMFALLLLYVLISVIAVAVKSEAHIT